MAEDIMECCRKIAAKFQTIPQVTNPFLEEEEGEEGESPGVTTTPAPSSCAPDAKMLGTMSNPLTGTEGQPPPPAPSPEEDASCVPPEGAGELLTNPFLKEGEEGVQPVEVPIC